MASSCSSEANFASAASRPHATGTWHGVVYVPPCAPPACMHARGRGWRFARDPTRSRCAPLRVARATLMLARMWAPCPARTRASRKRRAVRAHRRALVRAQRQYALIHGSISARHSCRRRWRQRRGWGRRNPSTTSSRVASRTHSLHRARQRFAPPRRRQHTPATMRAHRVAYSTQATGVVSAFVSASVIGCTMRGACG